MSRLARIGLWLLPWFAIAIIGVLAARRFPSYDPCPPDTGFGPLSLTCLALLWLLRLSALLFFAGLILLLVAGVRRMLRSRIGRQR
jgi:hypothetical protein